MKQNKKLKIILRVARPFGGEVLPAGTQIGELALNDNVSIKKFKLSVNANALEFISPELADKRARLTAELTKAQSEETADGKGSKD